MAGERRRARSAAAEQSNEQPSARFRMGPPPRSLAAEANDASWSGPAGSNRIQGCGAKSRAQRRAPLGSFAIPATASTKSPPQHQSRAATAADNPCDELLAF